MTKYTYLPTYLPTIVYDVATKVFDTKMFPQHTFADLITAMASIDLLSQEKPLQ